MSKALNPCPFCGHAEAFLRYHVEFPEPGDSCYVFCANKECEAEGPIRIDEGEAIEAWNMRYEEQTNDSR